jgi:hypothetical protein
MSTEFVTYLTWELAPLSSVELVIEPHFLIPVGVRDFEAEGGVEVLTGVA